MGLSSLAIELFRDGLELDVELVAFDATWSSESLWPPLGASDLLPVEVAESSSDSLSDALSDSALGKLSVEFDSSPLPLLEKLDCLALLDDDVLFGVL
jgi:hypothetical protein